MKERLYAILPNFCQNWMVTLYNVLAYKRRYGKVYKARLKNYQNQALLSLDELKNIQAVKHESFLTYVLAKSPYYARIYEENGNSFPIVNKEDLRKSIDEIFTIEKKDAHVAKTGGTTGKSLQVLFTKEDGEERFALLDNFRSQFGYKLGKKTAWFSGKNLLVSKDVSKKRFWKTDNLYNVRYYSTFHIKTEYMKHYVENIIKYKPEYIVGFPSSILEIAKYGLSAGYDFPADTVRAVFPTAETVTVEMRDQIERFFKTNVYDQYASSEGAPFVFECKNHKLHMELQSGVFEVLDENDNVTKDGRLIVTSFTTHGTPLVRYDIGDRMELSDEICDCGNNNPLVRAIHGRIDDYIYSPENGKVNLGNISNTLKDTDGIIKFQVVQDELNSLVVKIIVDEDIYNSDVEAKFLQNWRDRVGGKMELNLQKVANIPHEASGKYRFVKNNVKHLID